MSELEFILYALLFGWVYTLVVYVCDSIWISNKKAEKNKKKIFQEELEESYALAEEFGLPFAREDWLDKAMKEVTDSLKPDDSAHQEIDSAIKEHFHSKPTDNRPPNKPSHRPGYDLASVESATCLYECRQTRSWVYADKFSGAFCCTVCMSYLPHHVIIPVRGNQYYQKT